MEDGTPAIKLSPAIPPQPSHPIYKSIEDLDREGMACLCMPSTSKEKTTTHDRFATYMSRTKNTICGRHPIGVLLGALGTMSDKQPMLKWVRYEQSSQCKTVKDSSVSYASAYVVF